MKYFIDKDKGKSAYMQLYEQLRGDIVGGVYPFGTKLPSKRILSEETGVSVITAEHAYAILMDEGYIESRQRSGYYVIYREDDFISHTQTEPDGHIVRHTYPNTSKGEFPFSILARTMRKVLLDHNENILIKSLNKGCEELRTEIASYLLRSGGINVKTEQIIIGAGAEYLYSLIVQLLGKENIFAIEDPSYEKIRKVYGANGVKCDALELTHDGIRSSALKNTDAKVLHVTPFNSFPSGITASASKRAEYIRWAKARGGYIVEDNYDSELTVSRKNEDTLFNLSEDGSVIYLNTFSKTIAPSFRVGYMVLPENLLEIFDEKLGFYSCTVPVYEQYVLAELIRSGDFERHINRVRRQKRRNK
ncbi:MAG: PLP-dependent aminotransferase family protein [Anaerofustis stercorihominis]|nr:PLP-dependent aminotransferase family protein [Anaerofustis stercorihominis]